MTPEEERKAAKAARQAANRAAHRAKTAKAKADAKEEAKKEKAAPKVRPPFTTPSPAPPTPPPSPEGSRPRTPRTRARAREGQPTDHVADAGKMMPDPIAALVALTGQVFQEGELEPGPLSRRYVGRLYDPQLTGQEPRGLVEPMREMGMPDHEIAFRLDAQAVAQMSAGGMSPDEIAAYMGICSNTLLRHFRDDVELGAVRVTAQVIMQAAQLAMAGDTKTVKFWLERRRPADWAEQKSMTLNPGSPAAGAVDPLTGEKSVDGFEIPASQLAALPRSPEGRVLLRVTVGEGPKAE